MNAQDLISKWKEAGELANERETLAHREQLVSEMVSFMRGCGFAEEHLNLLNVIIVAESAHQPVRGFWQAFESSMVFEALDRYLPNWRRFPLGMTLDQFIVEVRRQMWMNAFDEENAERFFALPVAERPTSANAALKQIHADLVRIGAFAGLEKATADGSPTGARAFDRYQCIDAADKGKTHLTLLGQTVKECRDAARKISRSAG
ncbi:hypothetical protein B0G80_8602 [Paraburkholderia sp. BL6669N2]|uniref:hypothetical protein n=1 Tax=Paraburkholderia sp. BL6669N2 TaxID=1938807 RepID=UPI000E23781C|nr:hypothetical protein [Paraburkholderia sp. BL6669N2]REG52086.1 hypothetical protein B0G80_8602 [Paraburkholderia sp. BL6669N2]